MVLVCFARLTSTAVTEEGYTATTFVANIFLVQTWVPDFRLNWNYPAWSISSEWFAYLWFPVLSFVVLARVRSLRGGALLLALALLGSIVIRPNPATVPPKGITPLENNELAELTAAS